MSLLKRYVNWAIVLPVLVFLSFNSYAQTSWQWGRTAQGLTEAWPIAIDKAGNIFCAGQGSVSLPITFDTVILPGGAMTAWIKYNAAGTALWAGGITVGNGAISGIATDTGGNLILFGHFNGDSIKIGPVTLHGTYNTQYFLAKVNPSGTVLWAKNDGENYAPDGSVTTDDSGNIYVTGIFSNPSMTIGAHTLTNAGSYTPDIFIAKYDPSGTLAWAVSAGGAGADIVSGITVASGNIYIEGEFRSPSMTIGPAVISNPYAVNRVFIAKYSAGGMPLWAEAGGGDRGATCSGIASDAAGNIYISGSFSNDSIVFDTLTVTRTFNPVVLSYATFLVKYSPGDTAVWGRTISSPTQDVTGLSVATSSCGQVWLSANYYSQVIFAAGDTLNLLPGVDPVLMAGYDFSGNVLHYTGMGTGGDDRNALACDAVGNVFMSADFFYYATIGPDTFSAPDEQFFLAKYGNTPDTVHSHTALCETDTFALTASAGVYHQWDDGETTQSRMVNAPGIYWVFATSCDGSVRADTFIVSSFPPPAIYGPDSICLGRNSAFMDSTAGGNWYSSDSATATIDSASGMAVGVSNGVFTVTYSMGAGCIVTKTVGVRDCTAGVSAMSNNDLFSITPNPASNWLTVQTGAVAYSSYTMANSSGQVTTDQQIQSPQFRVDVSGLPAGIYYLRLKGEHNVHVCRFVKE